MIIAFLSNIKKYWGEKPIQQMSFSTVKLNIYGIFNTMEYFLA